MRHFTKYFDYLTNSLATNEFLTGETAASAFFLYLYLYASYRELSWQLSKFWVCKKLYSFNLIGVWKHISHTGIKWKKSPFPFVSNLTYQTCVCVLVSVMSFFRITWYILLQSVEGHRIPIIIHERNLTILLKSWVLHYHVITALPLCKKRSEVFVVFSGWPAPWLLTIDKCNVSQVCRPDLSKGGGVITRPTLTF